jgi:hypothetical protein
LRLCQFHGKSLFATPPFNEVCRGQEQALAYLNFFKKLLHYFAQPVAAVELLEDFVARGDADDLVDVMQMVERRKASWSIMVLITSCRPFMRLLLCRIGSDSVVQFVKEVMGMNQSDYVCSMFTFRSHCCLQTVCAQVVLRQSLRDDSAFLFLNPRNFALFFVRQSEAKFEARFFASYGTV